MLTATATTNANGTSTITLRDGDTVLHTVSLSAKRTAKGGELGVVVRTSGEISICTVMAPAAAHKRAIALRGWYPGETFTVVALAWG